MNILFLYVCIYIYIIVFFLLGKYFNVEYSLILKT